MPQAESTAARRGTITRRRSSWRAIAVTCRPAAPPKARSAKRRGSTPRRTETRRMPSAMRVLMTRWMPSAAAMRSTPSAAATRSTAASAAPPVEPGAAAEEVVGIEQPEDQVGVGHGRRRAAPAVAGGPGLGAGALGADVQHAAGIDPRDRAAAGADADDVERLQRDALAGEPPVGGDLRGAADDQRDVGAGAAHVEQDQVGLADQARGVAAAGDAAGRAGEHGAGGEPHGVGDRSRRRRATG